VFARIEPLAPAGLEAHRDGELLSRMVADIDQVQDLVLRLLPLGVAARLLPLGVAAVAGTMMVAAGVWNDRALVGVALRDARTVPGRPVGAGAGRADRPPGR